MRWSRVALRLGQVLAVAVTDVIVARLAGAYRFVGSVHGIVYLALWSIWLMATMIGRQRGAPTGYRRVGRVTTLVSYLAVPALLAVPPLDYAYLHLLGPRGGAFTWVGLALFGVGIGLQVSAMRRLGRHFTVRMGVRPNQKLVDSGAYRLVRHPGYLSYLVSLLGISLVFSSILTLVVLAAAAVFLVWHIRQEEVMLRSELAGYPEYAQRVRFRLIPGVW